MLAVAAPLDAWLLRLPSRTVAVGRETACDIHRYALRHSSFDPTARSAWIVIWRAQGSAACVLVRIFPALPAVYLRLSGKFCIQGKKSSCGERFVYLGCEVNMTSGIYPLNGGRWADLETDKVRAYSANLCIVSLRATPQSRRAYSAIGTVGCGVRAACGHCR